MKTRNEVIMRSFFLFLRSAGSCEAPYCTMTLGTHMQHPHSLALPNYGGEVQLLLPPIIQQRYRQLSPLPIQMNIPSRKPCTRPTSSFCDYPIVPLGPDTLYYACFYSQVRRRSYCDQTSHVNLAAAIQIDGKLEDGGDSGCSPTVIRPMQRRRLAGVARPRLPSRPLVGRGIPAG